MPCELNCDCVFQGGAALPCTHYPRLFSQASCPSVSESSSSRLFLFFPQRKPPPPQFPALFFFFFICQAGFALLKISINNAPLVSAASPPKDSAL